jgi:hypothetical protein
MWETWKEYSALATTMTLQIPYLNIADMATVEILEKEIISILDPFR